MERQFVPHETIKPAPIHSADVLLAQKQQIRALKRLLIAKAEVRRLKSLIGRRRISAR